MEAGRKRNIKSGAQFDAFFPKASMQYHTVKQNASVTDTVSFIPKVVSTTLSQTKQLAQSLRGNSDYETCSNIWHFVYDHIAYNKDRDGYEQIRSPARVWQDRSAGVDCDCYTTFISSLLTNLGIKHKLRITKYSKDYFQHIYPIALLPQPVILDCVTDKFDFEVPFSEKKDYTMDLQYLNGIDGLDGTSGLFRGTDGMEELGKLFKKKAKNNSNTGGGSGGKKKKGVFKKLGEKLKKVNLKKVLNVVNKVNPATIALRNGVLASMKINVGNVAKRLRWAYLTADQARAKGMDMGRWQRLVEVRQKLEKIFYGAGGKPENLKKAILHGKGNKDNGVHGIEGLGMVYYGFNPQSPMHPLNRVNKHTPFRQLLGDEIFFSENSVGTLGELGEPVTMTMIAAASGVIAAIASSIKKIGDIFGGKGKGSKDFDEGVNTAAEKEIPEGGNDAGDKADSSDGSDGSGGSSNAIEKSKRFTDPGGGGGSSAPATTADNDSSPATTSAASDDSSGGGSAGEEEGTNGNSGGASKAVAKKDAGSGDNGDKEGFWDKNKKWIVPAGIGAVVIGGIAIAASAAKSKPAAAARPMHGVPKKNYQRKKTQTKPTRKKGGKLAKQAKQKKAVKISH